MKDINFFNVLGSRKLRLAPVLAAFIVSAGFTKVHAQVDIDRYSGIDGSIIFGNGSTVNRIRKIQEYIPSMVL